MISSNKYTVVGSDQRGGLPLYLRADHGQRRRVGQSHIVRIAKHP